jgi:hypothetical protein
VTVFVAVEPELEPEPLELEFEDPVPEEDAAPDDTEAVPNPRVYVLAGVIVPVAAIVELTVARPTTLVRYCVVGVADARWVHHHAPPMTAAMTRTTATPRFTPQI